MLDIRKQEEVLQESYMMIPDSKSRLEKVVAELIDIVVSILLRLFKYLLYSTDLLLIVSYTDICVVSIE